MRTKLPKYKIVAKLPELSNNHPYARLVAILDEETNQLFVANTCDVHVRKAPWDGGKPSVYSDAELRERLAMMQASRLL
jgi:hypothetical protein